MKYSPEYWGDFASKYPNVARDFDKLAQDCHQAGPLDDKCRRLVKLGICIGIGSEGDVQSQVSQALKEGITPDEIRHAVLLALTTAGAPQMIVAMRWAEAVLKKIN